MTKDFSYRVREAIATEVGLDAFQELTEFLELLRGLSKTASKQTHYHKLDEWSDAVYGFVHKKLEEHGFINAAPLKGLEQPRDAEFWWKVYAIVGSVCYSPHLKTQVAWHHSSAWERNEALMADISDLIENKPKETILK
jgi:hypothetical protein